MKLSSSRMLAFGALALVLVTSKGSGSTRVVGKLFGRLDAATVRAIATPVANRIHQPGLPTMLAAVGYTESRYETSVINDEGMMGIFQLAPSSMRLADVHASKNVLLDPRWSTALLAWYYKRLQPYAAPGQRIDWLALRRGSAYPDLVSDVNETHARSREVRQRLEQALDKTGTPRSFMYQDAFPDGYQWPGIEPVLAAAGVRGVA